MNMGAAALVGERQQASMQSAIKSTAITAVVLAMFFVLGGRDSLNRSRTSEATAVVKLDDKVHTISTVATKAPLASGARVGFIPFAKVSKSPISPISPLVYGEFAEVRRLGQKALDSVEEMTIYTMAWQKDYALLLSDDRGRRIAGDRHTVYQYATIASEDLPDLLESLKWTFECNERFRPIRLAAEQNALDPGIRVEDKAYFENTLVRASKANEKLAARESAIKALIAATAKNALAERTLEREIEVIDRERRSASLPKAKVESEQRRLEHPTADEEIQKVDESNRIKPGSDTALAQERQRIAERVPFPTEIDTRAATLNAKQTRDRLESAFRNDEAEIRSLLAPFLAHGESQPALGHPGDSRTWLVPSSTSAPMSFAALQAAGALDRNSGALCRLYYMGGYKFNGRPKQNFPEFHCKGLSGGSVCTRVMRAQELLTKYGPLMVEHRMLLK